MKTILNFAGVALLLPALAAAGKESKPPKDAISMAEARQDALKVQAGTIKEGELEFEKGRWIYSFDIRGMDGKLHEVNLDAQSAKVVEDSVEDSAKEAKEAAEEPKEGLQVLKTQAVPGDGGWDFLSVDAEARRLYLTHADSVQVLDADSLKLLGTVSDIKRPHGVAVMPKLGRGFISSGEPGSVVAFDLKTFKRLSETKTSKDCDVILSDAATGWIWTFDGDSGDAFALDPDTLKVAGHLDLGGSPEVAVSDGQGMIYDNLSDKNQVLKIDAKGIKVVERWDIAPGTSPTGLALDPGRHRLFAACRNKLLVVLDTDSGKVLQTLPIGEHVDGAACDAGSGKVYASCGDGTLTVLAPDKQGSYNVLENTSTEAGARTLALDAKTGNVYTDTAQAVPPKKPDAKHPGHREMVKGTFHVLVLGDKAGK